MVKLVYTLVSGTSAARRGGSSPLPGNGYSLTAKGFKAHRQVGFFIAHGLFRALTPILTPFGLCRSREMECGEISTFISVHGLEWTHDFDPWSGFGQIVPEQKVPHKTCRRSPNQCSIVWPATAGGAGQPIVPALSSQRTTANGLGIGKVVGKTYLAFSSR